MSSIPIIVLSAISHGQSYPPYNGSDTAFSSDKVKGNGYYGYTDGLHTVSYKVTNFIGVLKFQATLAKEPTENDWFDLNDTAIGSGSFATTGTFYFNFSGNFVWCRAHIASFSSGNIDRVLYNT